MKRSYDYGLYNLIGNLGESIFKLNYENVNHFIG